jgi:YegS/Rv2252/BmrU family lipid kinase
MLDFIVNPIAGGKGGKKILDFIPKLKEFLKLKSLKFTIHFTKKKGEAKKLTDTLIKDGATDIVCIGGDGTLHEVINAFHSFDKANLGLIPCGTGNDFAFATKIPLDPAKALDIILAKNAQYTDFFQLPGVRGINAVGVGVDVDVIKRYEALKKKTKFGYTKCLIKTLMNFEYTDFTAIIDGEESRHCSFIADISNGPVYGGGIPICPIATPHDGELNFVAIEKIKKLAIIPAFLKLKRGKILSLKQSTTKPGKHIIIKPDKPCTINVDGELYDGIDFDVHIVSNTLKIYRP